jgi:hypothetical protein
VVMAAYTGSPAVPVTVIRTSTPITAIDPPGAFVARNHVPSSKI